MSIRTVVSGFETGKYKPIQAYVDRGVLSKFRARHPSHGDITKLIRNAFVIAISESNASIEGAMREKERQLPNEPPSDVIEIPCDRCAYRNFCVAEQQCVYLEAGRQHALPTTVKILSKTVGVDKSGGMY